MAVSNIRNVRTLDGKDLELEDVQVGLKVNAPSGLGGSFTYECVSLEGGKATFNCCHKSFPRELVIVFDVPDLTDEEMNLFSEAINAYDRSLPTQSQRELVNRASELGYASILSHTQAHWTQHGIDRYRAVTETP